MSNCSESGVRNTFYAENSVKPQHEDTVDGVVSNPDSTCCNPNHIQSLTRTSASQKSLNNSVLHKSGVKQSELDKSVLTPEESGSAGRYCLFL